MSISHPSERGSSRQSMPSTEPVTTGQVVCVLGMHRSGTSLTTRVLNLLGVYLGSDDSMLASDRLNAKGYWEHESILEINDELLARFGGSWHAPPAFPPNWERAPEIADLRRQARVLLEEEFQEAELWGWKDPRTCLTLPFWRQLVPSMRYVMCLRNPVDVARSLAHAVSFEQGVGLWLLYVRLALAQTFGEPRLLVLYEDLVTDWREQLLRLGRFVGRGQPSTGPETREAVSEFVGEELWHHRTALVDVIEHPSIPLTTKALYLVLRAARDDEQGSEISQAVLDSFASAVGSEHLRQGQLPASLEERDLPVAEDRYDVAVREAGRTAGSGQMAVRREETGTLAPLQALFEKETTGVPELISPNDTMFGSNPNSSYYFSTGQSALRCIKLAMLGAGTGEPRRILDLPSGHGRILRALKAAFPQAELTACDINRDGVDFCAQALGAIPVYSHEDPDDIELMGTFDLIFCGSLFTHLDADRWPGFLELFHSHLSSGGLLVFTTHGRFVVERLRSGEVDYGLGADFVTSLVTEFDQGNGFGYRDYPSYPGFGFSLTSPGWLCARLWELPGLQLVSFTERGWNQHQDVVAVRLRP